MDLPRSTTRTFGSQPIPTFGLSPSTPQFGRLSNTTLPPARLAPLPADAFQRQSSPGTTALRIVYNNDTHEKFKALPHLVSGFRFFSQQGQADGRDVLRLNAGDNNVGKEADEWDLNVRLMNLIQYQATALGNHELDSGSQGYANGLRNANFPTLLANLEPPPGSSLSQKMQEGKIQKGPLVVRQPQGVYGLIGVTTPELKDVISSQTRLEGEQVQSWPQTVETVKAQVRQLQQQGVNKIIVQSHMGLDYDQKLAQSVPGIDIIISGHSHDILHGVTPGINYLQSPTGEPVLIVQAGKNAQWMGVADVLFDAQGRVIPQRNTLYNPFCFAPDPQAAALRNSVLGTPRPIATLNTSYDASGNDFRADPIAQFTADAVRHLSGADIAFVRSPEIRNNITPGSFTDQDLKALMPFTDPVVRLNITGNEIIRSLERSAQGVATHTPHPGMLNPSGMAVSMDKATGRVTQAYVYNKARRQWEPLNPAKTYSVAIGEFTVKNREFPDLAHPEREDWNSHQSARQFFAWALTQSGAAQHPITLPNDNRLQIH
jgi:5'-nucleotidase/UDP-sugar diphosphatase